jgi:hypothetical protein
VPALKIGEPRELFNGRYYVNPTGGSPHPVYDVTRDGKRFLMLEERDEQGGEPPPPRFIVIENWTEELKRLVLVN